ncbi:MAG: hypothetical protein KIS78_25280 [Labilithrix sp.]|nr:hypothetical protein [Labilithrix sp.]MCW5835738.1 hypothetical protein [Labilithrix sp.]
MSTYSDYATPNPIAASESAPAYREGPIARRIERRTAKLPSDLFLFAAGAAVVASLVFEVMGRARGRRHRVLGRFMEPRESAPLASFIGMWVPSLLLFGVYNKIVKVMGSDKSEHA